MRITRWLGAAAMPIALGALLTTAQAQAQGKGKATDAGHEHAAPAQAHGAGKPEQARGRSQAPQRGPEMRGGESRRTESRGGEVSRSRVPAPAERGKAIERGNPSFDPNHTTGRELMPEPEHRGRGRLSRTVTVNDIRPAVRPFATSSHPAERFLGRAVGLAEMRGLSEDDFRIARAGSRVHVINARGDLLLDLDDGHARDIGVWKVATVDDRGDDGAPSFCRSGAGHPVWGRQWCIDKGFGLGMENDIRWGRAVDVGDVILRPTSSGDIRRDVLARVLGDVVFNRLAAHAITLGLADPLAGRWIGETTGPRVLLVTSGDRPVAEVVDRNRDSRADMLLVALRPW